MGCCKSRCGSGGLTDEQKKVLEAIAQNEGPCSTKDIAAATGLTSNAVSCRIRTLKNKGLVESPQRCKYIITEEGKAALEKEA